MGPAPAGGEPVTRITLPASLRAEMLVHAMAGRPLEACGLIGGRQRQPVRFWPTRNAAASPVRYEVDPRDLLAVTMAMEDEGSELWGIFHSHPATEAYPSQTDIRLAAYPDAVYLIASLAACQGADPAGAVLRAFRIRGTTVDEMELVSG